MQMQRNQILSATTPPLASRGHCNPSTQDGAANRSGFQGNSEGELQELVVMVSGFFEFHVDIAL